MFTGRLKHHSRALRNDRGVLDFLLSPDNCAEVARHLNERGIPAPRGGRWRTSTVWSKRQRLKRLGEPGADTLALSDDERIRLTLPLMRRVASDCEVTRILNREGQIPPPYGKRWHQSTISRRRKRLRERGLL